jgi:hypothetical protein
MAGGVRGMKWERTEAELNEEEGGVAQGRANMMKPPSCP